VDKEEAAKRLSNEIAKIGEHDLKAFRDKDRVIFMIQDAPEELRRLADALEKINIREIQAIVAFKDPKAEGPR
jgi:hypothetical protein